MTKLVYILTMPRTRKADRLAPATEQFIYSDPYKAMDAAAAHFMARGHDVTPKNAHDLIALLVSREWAEGWFHSTDGKNALRIEAKEVL